ncbi:hypothetical protein E4U36_005512, partial [Claviceps purpurea]
KRTSEVGILESRNTKYLHMSQETYHTREDGWCMLLYRIDLEEEGSIFVFEPANGVGNETSRNGEYCE